MFLDRTKQYLPSPSVVRCRGVEGIKTAQLMTMLGKDLYVSWSPCIQIKVRFVANYGKRN